MDQGTQTMSDKLTIEQRHRDAAADAWASEGHAFLDKPIREGACDHTWLPQAFARFEASLRTPTSEQAGEVVSAKMLGEVMQDAWGEICDDSGAHPLDINRIKGITWYSARHWTDLIALRLNERLSALQSTLPAQPTAKWGWTYYGPDGEWHWSKDRPIHEAILDDDVRPATPAEAQFRTPTPPAQPTDAESDRLRHVIDRDRYAAATVLHNIKAVLSGYRWLSEAGRDPYAYDDERYQREFGDALEAITAALGPLSRLAGDKSDCTTDPDKVKAAREAGQKRAIEWIAQPTADAVERLRERLNDIRDERHFPAHMLGAHDEMLEVLEAITALPTMAGDYVMVPNLLSAFRTTVSDDGKYEMVFRFKSMEAMHAADDEWRRQRNEKMGRNPRPVLETEKLVRDFADALLVKLAKAEIKYGHNDEWLTSDWEAVCKSELARHVAKGDPLDVAAYAAFCWARGWTTAPSPELAESQEEQPA